MLDLTAMERTAVPTAVLWSRLLPHIFLRKSFMQLIGEAFPEAAEAGSYSSLERYTLADLKSIVDFAKLNAV